MHQLSADCTQCHSADCGYIMLTTISALIVIVLTVTDDTSSIEHSCVVSIKKVYLNHADCTVSQCCTLTVLCHSADCDYADCANSMEGRLTV